VTGADIATWQSRMRAIVLEEVSESEIREVLRAVLNRAKAGDLQAARLVLQYAVGSPSRRDPDEYQASDAEIARTGARGGTQAKLDVLAYRRAHGLPLHCNGDGPEVDLS
jgi:hypothetical protein